MVYYEHSFQNSVLPFLEDLQDDQQKVCLFADFSQFHSSTLPMAFRRPRCSFVFTYLDFSNYPFRYQKQLLLHFPPIPFVKPREASQLDFCLLGCSFWTRRWEERK